MTTLAVTGPQGQTPEATYRQTTDPAERRRIQGEVVAAHRGRVAALIRRLVPVGCRVEGEQVGAIGVLVALEKYDPTPRPGNTRGPAFWSFASTVVFDEILDWRDRGIFWRPRTRKARPGFDERTARLQRSPASMDAPVGPEEDTLHDVVSAVVPTVEAMVSDLEAMDRLTAFADTLSAEDRATLFSENSQRVRSRRYLSLVERATAFVIGEKDAEAHAQRRTAGNP